MNGPVVDLARVRNALAKLDRLVAEHPERCNRNGPKWADHLPELDKLTMGTPVKQRIKDYRARLRAKGYKAATIYLPAGIPDRLAQLSQQTGLTYGDLVALALEHLETDPSGQPPVVEDEDATDRAALALAAAESTPVAVVADRLLSAALPPATPATSASDPDTLPLFEPDSTGSSPVESTVDRHAALMLEVDRRVNAGEKWRNIAAALNEAGWHDKAGKPLVFTRINEQWRRWKQEQNQ